MSPMALVCGADVISHSHHKPSPSALNYSAPQVVWPALVAIRSALVLEVSSNKKTRKKKRKTNKEIVYNFNVRQTRLECSATLFPSSLCSKPKAAFSFSRDSRGGGGGALHAHPPYRTIDELQQHTYLNPDPSQHAGLLRSETSCATWAIAFSALRPSSDGLEISR
ncbi:hypothetical protein LY78DRAFT_253505 [Colletotrichum sublineola]|nr:hypothetical protein LY78DRAFT_253505 [Colletotrichum sublineola]